MKNYNCKNRFVVLGEAIVMFGVILALLFGNTLSSFAQETSFLKTKVDKVEGPKLTGENRIKQLLRNLEVPKELGFVKEIHVPNSPTDKLIINIQDLHCHYQAQKNISGILDHLVTTHGLKVISVEGGSGKIDTTFYKELPDDKIKEQVADYFLKEARINGTEYYAINTKKNIALYGAEDPKYYDKNLDAFLKALPNRDNILEDIAILENGLNILKNKIYNKRMMELDSHIVAYDNEELGFEDYILYIAGLYPEKKLTRDFEQVFKLLNSIKIKKMLDLPKAENERKELIDYLTKNLPRNELESFLRVTVEFKAKTLGVLDYHNTIKQLYEGMDRGRKLSGAYAELDKYIEYLNQHETLDKFELFNQIDGLVDRIKNDLYTSYTQKKLDHHLRAIRLARNLYSTKLLNRDLPYVRKYKSDFNSRRLKGFIKKEAKRLKIDVPIPGDLEEMDKTLPILEDFYNYASQRNNILANNTIDAMNTEGENIGILITGGFHTDGISEYLKDKRVSYVIIAPQVDELEKDDTRYINALKGKKTPFEEMIENEDATLRDVYFEERQ
ncbi:MAG: hypothetical protein KKB82_09365 [Candidatus Omnitrophica bacterium]|nr:hypothetical protein [Candidatus Omnitrophota bacterium]MBU1926112.1 hypothetical protein [Candidatus Omnitrophota bacterium]